MLRPRCCEPRGARSSVQVLRRDSCTRGSLRRAWAAACRGATSRFAQFPGSHSAGRSRTQSPSRFRIGSIRVGTRVRTSPQQSQALSVFAADGVPARASLAARTRNRRPAYRCYTGSYGASVSRRCICSGLSGPRLRAFLNVTLTPLAGGMSTRLPARRSAMVRIWTRGCLPQGDS